MRSFTRFVSLAAAMGTVAMLGAVTVPTANTAAYAAESAGDYMDDTAISTKIKASLIKDQELKAFDIHVDTDHGVVRLSGNVDTKIQKADAVRIAKTTTNVRDVVNDIVVGANSK
jgi:hyperosmotically inducible periplasmic protein